jgi:hypothetical protein
MASVLGQPPSILPFDRREQPDQQLTGRAPGLRPGEPTCDPLGHLIEHPPPVRGGYAVGNSRREIVFTVHNRR